MSVRLVFRTVAAAAAAVALAVTIPVPAAAVGPPVIDPGALGQAMGLADRPAPPDPTEQSAECAEPTLTGGPPQEPPIAQRVLNLPAAWEFSRGAGQKVAVIDTGVNRHPRLPRLEAAGDYVSNSDGTADCDGHGTIVAGIIGAQPSPGDAFSGVAPDADLLTIRQLSLAYQRVQGGSQNIPGAIQPSGYGTTFTLAAAVVRAVNLGATVINISEVACSPAGGDTADAPLGAAVRYAYDRNVVVVAAAGNVSSEGACSEQNEGTGWQQVGTIATPAWFAPYVLTVASVDVDKQPSELSLHGPWVGVAAVGRDVVSLDSRPGGTGLVNGVQTDQGTNPLEGTSFAAPHVSGLVALVRARFPELSAGQVIDRIVRTSHAPGRGRDDGVGAGMIDPLAALTDPLPAAPIAEGADRAQPIAAPVLPTGPDPRPRRIAVIGSSILLAALVIGGGIAMSLRRSRSEPPVDLDL
ncbi:type VII secretion-associated serine protease mycosin [Nocardia sp. BMG51109]|uniref:type VII secretion-associated serine protease mycosin n=1 Tax=Nocardia sp. BMG51109 TaxID=1056816 RepID=UPI000464A938|nr:type VII secretion-associated serine protease mycosin [Nocardia sp. BMG51109]